MISDWDSVELYSSDKQKAPTIISYTDHGEPSSWGYGVPAEDMPAKWFKLCLLDDADCPPHVRSATQLLASKQLLRQAGKTAMEAIADYLRLL